MRQSRAKAEQAIGLVREAVEIRKQITEIYKQYRALTDVVCFAVQDISHHDLKRAVDALYYFGGGWPKPNSKGRMEALLDNFVGMYRILHFIGEGSKVEEHLAKYGVTVKLDKQFQIENVELTPNEKAFLNREYNSEVFGIGDVKDTRDLVTAIVSACMDLQREICGMADTIKEDLKPRAMEELSIEAEEYDRLQTLVRIEGKVEKVDKIKTTIHTSISNFNQGLSALAKERNNV